MYKTEKQLQQACYLHFHNTYPELRKCLFMAKNEGSAANYRGMGLVPGVADLCGCINGLFVSFELKLDGTRHEVKRLREQLQWRDQIITNGGFHSFVWDSDQFATTLKAIINGHVAREQTHIRVLHPLAVIVKAARKNTKTAKLNF